MKRVLVTAVGGDIGYGVIKSLKESSLNLFIVGCDIKKYNISYDLVDEFFICPRYSNQDAWLDYICRLIKSKNIDYFWPVTEPEIKIVNEKMAEFSSVKSIINNPKVLEVAMDKGETARFLKTEGLYTPMTWYDIQNFEFQYPVIVKEKFGCGSHAVSVVDSLDELQNSFDNMSDPIIQEYVGKDSDEYTLTIFSDGKVINHIAFKRELGFGGMSRYVELIVDKQIENIAETIAKSFDLHGSINVQMRKKNDNFYIFEINPRISSTMGFRLKLGFNDVKWWIDMVDNKEIPKYEQSARKMYGARSVEEKIFYDE